MDHNAVFEFEVLSFEHLKTTLATMTKAKSATRRYCAWYLIRLGSAVFACIISRCLIVAANGRIQMLMRCVLMGGC